MFRSVRMAWLASVLVALPLAPRSALAADPPSGSSASPAATKSDDWRAVHAGLEDASSQDCLGCHASSLPTVDVHNSHLVDVDYSAAAAKPNGRLRSAEKVRGSGVALPEGKVGCLTCHAFASPWKYHVVIPKGATPRARVRIADRGTYEDEHAAAASAAPTAGAEVSPKPLCEVCHAF
jgi:hypothetical protein